MFLLWSIWPTHDHCPLLLRPTMTTIYSCPSICPPHSKHRNPFFNQLYLSFPQLRPPTPYPVHKAADYLAWQPFQCQPPNAFATTFCLICPSPRSCLSSLSSSFLPESLSRSLHILASKAESMYYGFFTRKYLLSINCMKREACGHTEEKRGQQQVSQTLCPFQTHPMRWALFCHWLSGQDPSRGGGARACPFLSASCSCQYYLGQALRAAGSRWPVSRFQTLPEEPPCSPQRHQRPSQGPSPEAQLTGLLHHHCRSENYDPHPARPSSRSSFLGSAFAFFSSSTSLILVISVKKSSVISIVPTGPWLT